MAKYKKSINKKIKSAINIYWINSASLTTSLDEINEYTVNINKTKKVNIRIKPDILLK